MKLKQIQTDGVFQIIMTEDEASGALVFFMRIDSPAFLVGTQWYALSDLSGGFRMTRVTGGTEDELETMWTEFHQAAFVKKEG